jgi:hypothetical protein
MSEDKIRNEQLPNQPAHDNHGFEREDLSAGGVFYFMAGLGVVVVIIYFIVFGMYRFLNTYEMAHQPPMSPMVTAPADTRAVSREDTQTFPQPRLEESERSNLRQFIEDQDRKLATYNWVDKDKGIVQIPIDRAMDLIVKRGLPVRPENVRPEGSGAAQTSAPANQQTPKAPARTAAASGN